jgi:hypothetical protein
VLVAAPCQDRLIRGVSASAIVFDEASHFVSESWARERWSESGRPRDRCSPSTAKKEGRSGSPRPRTATTTSGACSRRPSKALFRARSRSEPRRRNSIPP